MCVHACAVFALEVGLLRVHLLRQASSPAMMHEILPCFLYQYFYSQGLHGGFITFLKKRIFFWNFFGIISN
jgi:hypothetical protein